MPGRYHYRFELPDSRVLIADYRDPIVARFHAINRCRAAAAPPQLDDLTAVTEWLNRNLAAVGQCARGECDHAP